MMAGGDMLAVCGMRMRENARSADVRPVLAVRLRKIVLVQWWGWEALGIDVRLDPGRRGRTIELSVRRRRRCRPV